MILFCGEVPCFFSLTTVTSGTAVTTVKILSQYFWKEQFNTFDNLCDVLRAAFCDSCNVFVWRGCMILFVDRLRDFSHTLTQVA